MASKHKAKTAARAPARQTVPQSLLIELLTEELPPKSLRRLAEAFSQAVFENLQALGLLAPEATVQTFATPRRLGLRITRVLACQADRTVERRGPAVSAGFDDQGQPTAALQGFARSCGVAIEKLERHASDKGEQFIFRTRQKGEALAQHVAATVAASLKKLPVAKLMRWGAGDAQFVRPVHGLILLYGKAVVPGTVLELQSGNKTRGHRILSRGAVTITHADKYEQILQKTGKVIADFGVRRAEIETQLRAAADKVKKGAQVLPRESEPAAKSAANGHDEHDRAASEIIRRNAELLDEVTALVEWPAVYTGAFDAEFLRVPIGCLALSMQQHQRYFPLVHSAASERMLAKFLMVSNNAPRDPRQIVRGNERVLRARLADARFFFDQDRKTRLADRVPRLANVVYHNKLGSQLARVERLQQLASEIARRLRISPDDQRHVERAAYLSKADLLTDMVGEFPELQGSMGAIYARHDGESERVAQAIQSHYAPRFAGDGVPGTQIGLCLAAADKLDSLVGIYGVGLVPTGDKDPYGLRRAALGLVRIVIEKGLPLGLKDLLKLAVPLFKGAVPESVSEDIYNFILDRLRPYLREHGFKPDEIEAVLAIGPTRLDQVLRRLEALQAFRRLPEAEALAAANKRISNILRQAGDAPRSEIDPALLREPAERQLAQMLVPLAGDIAPLLNQADYTGTLKRLASLRPAVDEFFDKVMVMAEEPQLRNNRLALLDHLSRLFLQVADIARLQS